MTDESSTSNMKVVVSDRIVTLFTNRWFQGFRHALPLVLLVGIGILLGFPSLGNEYLILVPIIVALCTSLTRYAGKTLASETNKRENSRVLLELNDNDLHLALDFPSFHIRLDECRDIRVYRVLWWLSPYIVFSIKRNDGYERRILTHIDVPELYDALKHISDEVLPAPRDATGPFY